jgi:CDP-diglyceride synthetase
VSDRDQRRPHEPPDPSEGVRIIGPDEQVGPQRGDPRARRRPGGDRDPFIVPVEGRRPQPDASHWDDRPPDAAPNEEVPHMSRRDPYEGDEAGAWGTFAGTEPRWRDDQQGYAAEPPPGRSVFGDEAGPSTGTYEDAYSQHTYDDRGYDPRAQGYQGQGPSQGQGYEPQGYADQSYTDRGPDPRIMGPDPRSMGPDPRYQDSYDDDGYDDDVYRETPRGFGEPPEPPRQAPRSQRRRTPGGGGERDMRTAVAVGVGMAVAALVLFKVGPPATMILVVAILGLASFEYFTATQRAGFDPLMPVGVVATVSAVIAAYNYGESALLLVLVLSVAVCTVWYLLGAGGERPMANVGATLLGICWVGVLGAFAGLLLSGAGTPHGIAFLLAALLPTIGYDVGALFVGRSAGSRPLSPASPNKTLEGLIGGMVLAVLGGLLLGVLKIDPFDTLAEGLTVGLVAAVAAPLGDLSESLIKRDLGVKDMGTLLPGHGGLLDRFDAMLFVLPAIWYTLRVSEFFLT